MDDIIIKILNEIDSYHNATGKRPTTVIMSNELHSTLEREFAKYHLISFGAKIFESIYGAKIVINLSYSGKHFVVSEG